MNINDLRPASEFAKHFGVKSIVYGPPGSGKCLAPGTLVLMFDGSVKAVEHIKVNDLLMGPDSNPRLVTHLAYGFDDMFDIIPVKGMTYRVNKPHILSLKRTVKDSKEMVNVTVNDYLKLSNNFKYHFKGWRTGVNFPTKQVYINPYLLGLWLGDGSSDELAFHTVDKPIVDFLKKAAVWYGLTIKEYKKDKKCPRYRLSTGTRGLSNKLRECFNMYNLFNNKHIPEDFKINSAEIRANVLAGLLDTDGHLGSNCFTYVSKLEHLADDVCYLARSLGLAAYKSKRKNECVNNGVWGYYYSVSISGNTWIIPTQLIRKQATKRTQKKNVLHTGIKVIPAGYGEYYGFELAGPDKLFLLGDFTVTHNTPVINTAPRPVLLVCEPGLLSMRNSTVPTYQAFTAEAIDDFFKWFFNSNETKNFDTLAVDSVSQMAEIYLQSAQKNNKHGLAAYGEMARNTLKHLEMLYYFPYKHTYLIAKESIETVNGLSKRRPYFPGQQLPVEVPHKYDAILHLDIHNVPGMGQIKSFLCNGSIDAMARNRTGTLADFEPPDFSALVAKAMI